MKSWIQRQLKKGIEYYDDPADQRRVLLFNFLCFGYGIIPIPILIINLIQRDYIEVLALVAVMTTIGVSLVLNRKGRNQLAVLASMLISMAIIAFASFRTDTQIGGPYGNLLIVITSVFLIRHRTIRILIAFVAIGMFLVTNYVQLKFHEFNEPEYFVIVTILGLFFLAILFYDQEMIKYQETIKKQSNDLLELEEERHQQDLALKQKDLEMMLASSSARNQLTENLSTGLREALESEDPTKNVNRVLNDLNAQNDLLNKQVLANQNIDEINADFYKRLLDKFPSLTKSERELCSYLKLSLSNKEIAAIKNSTENTVNVSKARLRKKMNLDSNKELARFLAKF